MLVVVDVNVVFSALVTKGNSFKVFEANKLFNEFEFIAPEFLFFEIGKRIDKLLTQTKLSKKDLSQAYSFIKKQISIIPFTEFSDKIPKAIKLNFKDSPYLALALKLNCPILSGDKELKKQTKIKIIPPSKALSQIYK